MDKITEKQWIKTFTVMLFLPLIFLWFTITKIIEWNYFLLSKITNKCDFLNGEISDKVQSFIWGEDNK